jgi:hypothetical protein
MTKHIILPGTRGGMDHAERMKLTVIAISTASYARMFQLQFMLVENQTLNAEDERDFKRLMHWYQNLGSERKEKLDTWIYDLSRDTEDVTEHSGRKVDDANKKAMKKITKWESNQ